MPRARHQQGWHARGLCDTGAQAQAARGAERAPACEPAAGVVCCPGRPCGALEPWNQYGQRGPPAAAARSAALRALRIHEVRRCAHHASRGVTARTCSSTRRTTSTTSRGQCCWTWSPGAWRWAGREQVAGAGQCSAKILNLEAKPRPCGGRSSSAWRMMDWRLRAAAGRWWLWLFPSTAARPARCTPPRAG